MNLRITLGEFRSRIDPRPATVDTQLTTRQRRRISTLIAALSITLQVNCATSPNSILPAQVSPEPYLQMDCAQLAAEYARVKASLEDAQQVQTSHAQQDSTTVAVGVLLFPPIVAAVQGDRSIAADIARLKGERTAIEDAMARKNCNASQEGLSR
jgi:hypothetical protein